MEIHRFVYPAHHVRNQIDYGVWPPSVCSHFAVCLQTYQVFFSNFREVVWLVMLLLPILGNLVLRFYDPNAQRSQICDLGESEHKWGGYSCKWNCVLIIIINGCILIIYTF